MKTPVSSIWIPGLILGMGWMSVGLAENDTNRLATPAAASIPVLSPAPSIPAQAAPSFPAIGAAKDSPTFPLPEGNVAVIKRQPPKLRLSPWTSEIVKLAESGVEASVILAFIENSGTFNLGADHIVYLNDLGLSGEVINAMLEHDRDVISGAKPLTITSEPEWEFPFDSIFVEKPASDKPLPKPSTTQAPAAATAEPASMPAIEAVPEINHTRTATQFATTENPLLDETATAKRTTVIWHSQSTDRKKSPYPVREPYPVEITSPIVFINADGRIPNTLVVLGFPRPTP